MVLLSLLLGRSQSTEDFILLNIHRGAALGAGMQRVSLGKKGIRNSRDWPESFGTHCLLRLQCLVGTGDAMAGTHGKDNPGRDRRRSQSAFAIR